MRVKMFITIDIDEEEGKPYNTIYDIFREDKIWWSRREARRGTLREVTPEEEQKYYQKHCAKHW